MKKVKLIKKRSGCVYQDLTIGKIYEAKHHDDDECYLIADDVGCNLYLERELFQLVNEPFEITSLLFNVTNQPELSALIQTKLFELGYSWACNERHVQFADSNYLWAGPDGLLKQGNRMVGRIANVPLGDFSIFQQSVEAKTKMVSFEVSDEQAEKIKELLK